MRNDFGVMESLHELRYISSVPTILNRAAGGLMIVRPLHSKEPIGPDLKETVELFLKRIRQHLCIKAFFGTSENDVKT